MGGISKLLNRHFSGNTIRHFAICGKQEDIVYQVSHGLQKEVKRGKMLVGYELTEKGKKQIERDNQEIEKIPVSVDDLDRNLHSFFEDEKAYWKEHPAYTKEEEYRRMDEDEEYAYKYLQSIRSY